ncbi:MAG TPA: Bax inhibitor-1/YccA family protein, partial [Burkholderiales bacterium]|nr:Bax inhibitor-1/YccA family protein [Burkholderiales bacterium]
MQPDLQATAQSTQLALVQHKVLRNTYLLLALTMIPTVIGALVGTATDFTFLAQHPIMGPLLMLAAMFGLMFAVGATRNSIWGVALLLAFTFVMGWWLGPMLQYALHFRNGGQLVGIAAGGTGVIFFTLAGIATVTRKDFSFMGKFLMVGLVLLLIASIANLFFQIPAASMTLSALIILLFSGYILYDVSQIVQGGETNYVMATLKIYLDIYNIFINLLNLLLA